MLTKLREEPILPLTVPLTPMSHLRGTVLVNSHRIIAERGLSDEYWARLPAEHHDAMRALVPLSWVPLEPVCAHYAVLSTLVTDHDELIAIGHESAQRVQQSYVETLFRAMRLANALSVDRALPLVPRVFERVLRGGGLAIYRVGPKDARIECHQMPVMQHAYFRVSWQGWAERALRFVNPRTHVKALPDHGRRDRIAVLVSWV